MPKRKTRTAVADQALLTRRADRKIRAENDPYFGRRRSAGEMGRTKTKAEKSRKACRGRVAW